MNGNHTVVSDFGKSFLNGMESFFATGHDLMFCKEFMTNAKAFPDRDLRFWSDDHDLHGDIIGPERVDGIT